MLKKLGSFMLFCGLPAMAIAQPPLPAQPQQGVIVRPTASLNPEQLSQHGELRRLIESREALTREIERLQKRTGVYEQVLVSVRMYELSLTKLQGDLPSSGDLSKRVREKGFRAALAMGELDQAKPNQEIKRPARASESLTLEVIENTETLENVLAELKEAEGLAVLVDTTLATLSGRQASLHHGGEFPIHVVAPSGEAVVEYMAFGTQLDVTSKVLGRNRLQLAVSPKQSRVDTSLSVEKEGTMVPGLQVRGVSTQVELNSGQTLVLAGLVQRRTLEEADPSADRPSKTEESELIVILRPEIVVSLQPREEEKE